MHVRQLCVALVVVAGLATMRAQDQPLDELLPRVGDYVRRFVDDFSNVVAEERYEPAPGYRGRKRLLSDYSLVRSPRNQQNFMTFRDVLEVNGKAVRNHQQLLTKLFLASAEDALEQARAISAHSEEHIPATTDPLLALVFLQQEYQARFRFTLIQFDPDVAPGVRRIGFLETRSPSILRSSSGDLPTTGAAWVSAATGQVLKTELQFGSEETQSTILTVFGADKSLRIDVPLTMSESSYVAGRMLAKGVARYSRFRRFGVRTDETIDSPKP